ICPPNSTVKIFTDSQSVIDAYSSRFCNPQSSRLFTPRRKLKCHYHQIWAVFDYIIKTLHLQVELTKVKAHSGDTLNDHANSLAKRACALQCHSLQVNSSCIEHSLGSFHLIDHTHPIDGNIRKWSNTPIQAYVMAHILALRSFQPLNVPSGFDNIDWDRTSSW